MHERYEMEWGKITTRELLYLTERERQYASLRQMGYNGTDSRKMMGISDRYLWDLKRRIAGKLSHRLKWGNRGMNEEGEDKG